MAGRSTPGSTPSTNIPLAMAAPVLPAETKAPASPSLTSSAATRSDESRLRRTACEADSPMPITWDAWWIVRGRPEARGRGGSRSVGGWAAAEAGDLALDGGLVADESDGQTVLPGRGDCSFHDYGRAVVSPHGVDGDSHVSGSPGGLDAHETDAELCPFDREDLPPFVVAAVGADPVGQLGLPALGAGRERGGRGLVVGPALAAGGGAAGPRGRGG